jgi:hypothetical protein
MNKKGVVYGSSKFAWAVIIGVILLIFLVTGGIITISNISGFMTKVPAWAWVILGVIILFKVVGGKRR